MRRARILAAPEMIVGAWSAASPAPSTTGYREQTGPRLLQLDLGQALFEVTVRGDRLRVPARVLRRDARGQHVDHEIRIRMQEERRRIAWLARLVTRRIDHAMRG